MQGRIARRTVALRGFGDWSHATSFALFAQPLHADEPIDWCMTVQTVAHITPPAGTPQGHGKRTAWMVDEDGNGTLFHARGAFLLRFDAAFSRCELLLHEGLPEAAVLQYVYTAQCFAYHMLSQNACCVHSAALEKDGHAILLVGPSGVGKSTLATACQTVDPSIRVLCEDMPAVRFENGIPMVYGTPFCGNDTRVENACARLDAIVLLRQAPHNCIGAASSATAMSMLLEAMPHPIYSTALTDAAVTQMQQLYEQVPIRQFENQGTVAAGEQLLAAWHRQFQE